METRDKNFYSRAYMCRLVYIGLVSIIGLAYLALVVITSMEICGTANTQYSVNTLEYECWHIIVEEVQCPTFNHCSCDCSATKMCTNESHGECCFDIVCVNGISARIQCTAEPSIYRKVIIIYPGITITLRTIIMSQEDFKKSTFNCDPINKN